MITLSLLCFAVLDARPATGPEATPTAPIPQAHADEVDDAIAAAGKDVAELLELAAKYADADREADARRVYERVIELDTDNADARAAMRHEFYDGRWFESYVKLARYKREEAKRMREKGLVRYFEDWVPEDEIAFLRLGWVRDENGEWVDPVRVEEARVAAELEAAGHRFRADDSSWVAPEDFDKWAAIQWKCGDVWLDTAEADRYHANPSTPWVLTGEHYLLHSTCPWDTANAARWHADRTHEHLVRLFGVAPEHRPDVLVLNSLAQYNSAAGGDWNDVEGYSSLHGAYFCEEAGTPAPVDSRESARYLGRGVSYWATDDPALASWGPFWVRWAAAQSYVDAIDFSWQAVGRYVGPDEMIDLAAFGQAFWEEKRLPLWLRYGAATYVERFLPNPEVDASAAGENPWNLREFALEALRASGGLRPLDEVFEFGLSVDDTENSSRLYQEAGLLVAFLLDGSRDGTPLRAAHERLREALAADDAAAIEDAVAKLEAALKRNDAAIREFAGF